ncbi:hypothetical protein CKA32_005645 [Geitlerinema sp. FC II]|nr:hypothetical protein CKA32_005645 [Geitlerinema sp. FC II]
MPQFEVGWVSRSLHSWTAALPKSNLLQTYIFTLIFLQK